MGNKFAAAMTELREVMDEEMGAAQKVKIRGKAYPARVSELTLDEIVVAGGNAESGGFTAEVEISNHPLKPAKGAPIEYDGMTLEIQTVTKTNKATWSIQAFDMATE